VKTLALLLSGLLVLAGCSSRPSSKTSSNGGTEIPEGGSAPEGGTTLDGSVNGADAGEGGPMNLGYIAGPVTDNQAIVTVPLTMTSMYSVDWFFSDAAGNLFLAGNGTYALFPDGGGVQDEPEGFFLDKYSPNFKPLWSVPLPPPPPGTEITFNYVTGAPGGGFLLSGDTSPNPPYSLSIGKLHADGSLAGLKSYGPYPNSTVVDAQTETPDGALLVIGTVAVPAPKDPTSTVNVLWLARYEADGTTTFFKQYPCSVYCINPSLSDSALLVEVSGNIDFATANSIVKFDAHGMPIGTISLTSQYKFGAGTIGSVDLAPNMDGFYSWAPVQDTARGYGEKSLTLGLERYDADGRLMWYRLSELPRTGVIDAGSNETWTGSFPATSSVTQIYWRIVVTKDSVYLLGAYENDYSQGESTFPLYIGRYDLNGNRIWFQELAMAGHAIAHTAASSHLDPNVPVVVGLQFDAAGDPILFVNVSKGLYASDGYLFKLSATDGTLM
jgi:hypothetical protein